MAKEIGGGGRGGGGRTGGGRGKPPTGGPRQPSARREGRAGASRPKPPGSGQRNRTYARPDDKPQGYSTNPADFKPRPQKPPDAGFAKRDDRRPAPGGSTYRPSQPREYDRGPSRPSTYKPREAGTGYARRDERGPSTGDRDRRPAPGGSTYKPSQPREYDRGPARPSTYKPREAGTGYARRDERGPSTGDRDRRPAPGGSTFKPRAPREYDRGPSRPSTYKPRESGPGYARRDERGPSTGDRDRRPAPGGSTYKPRAPREYDRGEARPSTYKPRESSSERPSTYTPRPPRESSSERPSTFKPRTPVEHGADRLKGREWFKAEGKVTAKPRPTRAKAEEAPEVDREPIDRVMGILPVLEMLRARGRSVDLLYIDKEKGGKHFDEMIKLAKESGVNFRVVPKEALDDMAGSVRHQGVVAVVAPKEYADAYELIRKSKEKGTMPLIVVLDGVEDPHNLGAILRTAESAGADGIVIPEHRAARLTATVAKVSAGALEHIDVAKVGNLADFIGVLKKEGFWVLGLEGGGSANYTDFDMNVPLALVMGGEGKGVRPIIAKSCDALVSLPMLGKVDSLNVSVAAGIVLYEAIRQRRQKVS